MLAGDAPPSLARCRDYAKRMWIEEGLRDDKSFGFHWERSRVRQASHATRLLLVLQLAMYDVLSRGQAVVKHGLRRLLSRGDRWEVGLGLRWLRCCLANDHTLSVHLGLSRP